MAMGKGFFQGTSKFPSQYHSTKAPFSSSSARYYYQDKRAKPGNLPNSNALLGIGEHLTDKYDRFFSLLQSVDFRGYVVAHNNYVWKGGLVLEASSLLDLSYSVDVGSADTFRNSLYIGNFRSKVSTGHTCRWKQCSSCPNGFRCRCKM